MSLQIRPSQREVMELQRLCRDECQPYIDLMVREMSMDTRTMWIFREDGTLDQVQLEESVYMKGLRAHVDAIIKRYTALANGEELADNAVGAGNL